VQQVNKALNGSNLCSFGGQTVDLSSPWPRATWADMFEKYTSVKQKDWENIDLLKNTLGRNITISPDHSNEWEDLFLALFLEKVEPKLGLGQPLLLYDFPARMAALSKLKAPDEIVAERVELYIQGIELANGYTELNDPREQALRFQLDQERKMELGSKKLPIDHDFLTVMEHGMPPAGGMALGLDRLLMLLTDQSDIESVLPFPLPIDR